MDAVRFAIPLARSLLIPAGFILFSVVAFHGSGAVAQATDRGSDVTVSGESIRRLPEGMAILERVADPFETVIVGDPAVVATSVVNTSTLALTGKMPGRTNIILLDESGGVQARWNVEVTPAEGHRAAVYHGTELQVITCYSLCSPVLLPNAPVTAP